MDGARWMTSYGEARALGRDLSAALMPGRARRDEASTSGLLARHPISSTHSSYFLFQPCALPE